MDKPNTAAGADTHGFLAGTESEEGASMHRGGAGMLLRMQY